MVASLIRIFEAKSEVVTVPSVFIENQLYNRKRDIHDKYGGSAQSGISPSAKFPYIFIFSGKSGHQHGYKDGWENPHVFSYTGEGQSGDMGFNRGNLALNDHKKNGKRVFLFEADGRGTAKFIVEVEVFDVDYFETLDTTGKTRIGIKFFFKRVGDALSVEANQLNESIIVTEPLFDYGFKRPNETERKGLVTSRVGQGAYRKSILHRWEYKCAVTGFEKLDVLVASHIVPWSKATNDERLDPYNGILLSPTYDALFDRHFISFEKSGKIILTEKVNIDSFHRLGVTGKEVIKDFRTDNHYYLERHRDQFNEVNH